MATADWLLDILLLVALVGICLWAILHQRQQRRRLVQELESLLPSDWCCDPTGSYQDELEFFQDLHRRTTAESKQLPFFYQTDQHSGEETTWLFGNDKGGLSRYTIGNSATWVQRLSLNNTPQFLLLMCSGKFLEDCGDDRYSVVRITKTKPRWMLCDRVGDEGGWQIAEHVLSAGLPSGVYAVQYSRGYIFVFGKTMLKAKSYVELIEASEHIVGLLARESGDW